MDQKPLGIVSSTTVLKPEASQRVEDKQNLALVPRNGGAQKGSSQTKHQKKKEFKHERVRAVVPCLTCEMIDEQDSADNHE